MRFKQFLSVICTFSMLLSSIPCCKAEPTHAKIVFFGDAEVGKTQIINRIVHHEFSDDYKPDIIAEFHALDVNNRYNPDRKFKLKIWDTTGQEIHQNISLIHYNGANFLILVCDVTNQNSINHLEKWKNDFGKENPDTPIIIVGNKIDLLSPDKDRENCRRQLIEKASECGIENPEENVVLVSAKTGEGIEELENLMIQTLERVLEQNLPEQNDNLSHQHKPIRLVPYDLNETIHESKVKKYGPITALVASIIGGGCYLYKKVFGKKDTNENHKKTENQIEKNENIKIN